LVFFQAVFWGVIAREAAILQYRDPKMPIIVTNFRQLFSCWNFL
jgi:hypothetical protein